MRPASGGPGNPRALALSDQFLQAGFRLSATTDFAQLSDRAVAQAAEASVADFRSIFGDLEAYIHVLQLRLSGELGQALQAALKRPGPRQQRLQAAASAFLDLRLARRGAHAWIAALARRSAPLHASRRKHRRQHARMLESAFGEIPAKSAEAAARLLLAAMHQAAGVEAVQGAASAPARTAIHGFIQTCIESTNRGGNPGPVTPGDQQGRVSR